METKNFKLPKVNSKRLRNALGQKPSNTTVDSPLAKYDACGNTICIICRSVIKSAALWKVHINSKKHKIKIETAKKLRGIIPNSANSPTKSSSIQHVENPVKHSNSSEVCAITTYKINVPSIYHNVQSTNYSKDNTLPEQFFDDPISDAKVRNIEYKNSQDEEWEKFQREIKEESTTSNAIIAGEQLESTVIRQIEEIDEQMERWVKVRTLEEKIECIIKNSQSELKSHENSSAISSDEEEDDSFDEFSNWRAKKF